MRMTNDSFALTCRPGQYPEVACILLNRLDREGRQGKGNRIRSNHDHINLLVTYLHNGIVDEDCEALISMYIG